MLSFQHFLDFSQQFRFGANDVFDRQVVNGSGLFNVCQQGVQFLNFDANLGSGLLCEGDLYVLVSLFTGGDGGGPKCRENVGRVKGGLSEGK